MQKNKFIAFLAAAFFVLAFLMFLKNSFHYLDVDFGWHIKIGQEIIANQAAPSIDIHNYPILGRSWMDHEWLFNVVIYWLYDNIGYGALTYLFAILALSVYVINYRHRFAKFSFDVVFFIIFSLIGIMSSLPQLGVRMQELSHLMVLLLLVLLDYYGKSKNKKLLLLLPPMFVVWANFHGSFLIGYFILGFWVLIKTIEFYLKKYREKINIFDYDISISLKEIWLVAPATIVSLVATFINPYGWRLYQFLFDYTDSFYLNHIEEWLPFYYWPINLWGLLYFSLVIVSFVMYFVSWHNRRKKTDYVASLNLWHFGLIIFFLVMSLNSKRHLPLLVLVSIPWLVHLYSSELLSLEKFLVSSKELWLKIIRMFVILGVLLAILNNVVQVEYTNSPFDNKLYCRKLPCDALNFLKNSEELKDKRLLNNFGWGGFIMWVWPEKLTFIDGRFPQFRFNEHSFLEEYLEFFNKEKVKGKLDDYKIEVVLMRVKGKVAETSWLDRWMWEIKPEDLSKKSELVEYLSSSPDWRECYLDKVSVIYCRVK